MVQKTRFQMDLTPTAKANLDKLMVLSGSNTMSEAFRKALAVYSSVLDATQKDAQVLLVYPDGTKERLIIS